MKNTDAEFLDRKYLWHPFTQMSDWQNSPQVIIERGEGVFLYDIEGKRYLDGTASLWCNVHGHAHPAINAAIAGQAGKIAHSTLLGLGNVPAAELAEKLVSVAPDGLTKAFFSENGSSAVEVALKMAYQYWRQKEPRSRKGKFLSLNRAYHGDTLGAVSVGGIELFHETYRPMLFDTFKAPSPYCYRCELNLEKETCGMACAKALDRLVREHRDELAAVIIEPLVQGAGGMITSPPGYLASVEKSCRENSVLLIADCVAVGFGRTGRMFACEHENVRPDLMVVGKGLSGGYLPISATLATTEVFDAFLGDFQKTFYHGHTFSGNQLAATASLASLELFQKDGFLHHLPQKSEHMRNWCNQFLELDHVGDVRLRGLMGGIELVKDKATKEPYPAESRTGWQVCREARNYGLLIRPLGDVIVIMPPLCIGEQVLGKMLEIIGDCILKVTEGQAPTRRLGDFPVKTFHHVEERPSGARRKEPPAPPSSEQNNPDEMAE